MSRKEPATGEKSLKRSVVLDRSEKGDRSVLPQVREILDGFPDVIEESGDLNRMARGAMIDLVAGKHPRLLLLRD